MRVAHLIAGCPPPTLSPRADLRTCAPPRERPLCATRWSHFCCFGAHQRQRGFFFFHQKLTSSWPALHCCSQRLPLLTATTRVEARTRACCGIGPKLDATLSLLGPADAPELWPRTQQSRPARPPSMSSPPPPSERQLLLDEIASLEAQIDALTGQLPLPPRSAGPEEGQHKHKRTREVDVPELESGSLEETMYASRASARVGSGRAELWAEVVSESMQPPVAGPERLGPVGGSPAQAEKHRVRTRSRG